MPGEILASLADINTHLPADKAKMEDSDDDLFQIDAARYVRSLLAGMFSASTLQGWDTPANTPELIRGVAGRIIAAKWYATLFSEDVDGVSAFAQSLYDEANAIIVGIRSGINVVLDSNDSPIPVEIGLSSGSVDFWPNDSTAGPIFAIGQNLG
jgi:hypothetical protein